MSFVIGQCKGTHLFEYSNIIQLLFVGKVISGVPAHHILKQPNYSEMITRTFP